MIRPRCDCFPVTACHTSFTTGCCSTLRFMRCGGGHSNVLPAMADHIPHKLSLHSGSPKKTTYKSALMSSAHIIPYPVPFRQLRSVDSCGLLVSLCSLRLLPPYQQRGIAKIGAPTGRNALKRSLRTSACIPIPY